MSRNWTKEQLDAIQKDGTNIIVSAGAGSGKTAVLTERVIRKLHKGININELLVLTFTKAAAHEMKERIRVELKKDDNLKEQLSLIDASYITTFDSFALSVVKKYHYILNVSPNVSIIDTNILKMRKSSIIDNIFDELYKEEDTDFLNLISTFCVKDDKNIKNYILKINDKLDMKYDKYNYLDTYLEEHFTSSFIQKDIDSFVTIIKDKCNEIDKLLNVISTYVDSDYYGLLCEALKPLLESTTYNECKYNLNIDMPRIPKNTDELGKFYRDEISNIIKYLNSICVFESVTEIENSIIDTRQYINPLIKIIKELDSRIKQYKFDNDLYEFTDIANLSIKLIRENDDIRNELKASFKEILVDEYQDTNDLQEAFISLISDNNVYMVGDIKQSIYRFRNANPNIFKGKYELYKNNNQGLKIDLNKNFRSRGEVLSNINLIFDDIMDLNFGGANYRQEHRLVLGNTMFETIGNNNQNSNLEIYNYSYDKELDFKKEEIEIFLIANDIKDKITNHYQVIDSKTMTLRDVRYSDFAILLDRSTQFDLYKKIFTYMGIPLIPYKDEAVTSTSDILVIKSLLKMIDCLSRHTEDSSFKYAFMSVGRSFLYSYSDEELFDYITKNEYKQTELYEQARAISNIASALSIDSLLSLVIKEFKVVEKTITIGNVSDMISRIDYMIENAKTLSSMGYNLSLFIEYLEENFDTSDVTIALNKDDSNACHLMTIHKSKGLEYNICYYAGLYAGFNISDLKEIFYYDTYYGFVIPYFNEGISNTIYKTLLNEKYIKEEIEEKIRLFYVALTRCKEKMIVIADLDTKEVNATKNEDGVVDTFTRIKYRSFRDILLSVKESLIPFITNMDLSKINLNHDYIKNSKVEYKNRIPQTDIKINSKELSIDSHELKGTSYSRKVNTLLDNKAIEALKVGKYIHYCLETIDFKNPNFDNIDFFYQKKIKAFLDLDILKDIDIAKVYKEYEFIYDDNSEEHHGIIDLMLEYPDHIKIIDYKFKDITKEEYDKQLNGYRKYIQKISNKRVELYLYSIIDEEYRTIDSLVR